jgi:hypothetical protein
VTGADGHGRRHVPCRWRRGVRRRFSLLRSGTGAIPFMLGVLAGRKSRLRLESRPDAGLDRRQLRPDRQLGGQRSEVDCTCGASATDSAPSTTCRKLGHPSSRLPRDFFPWPAKQSLDLVQSHANSPVIASSGTLYKHLPRPDGGCITGEFALGRCSARKCLPAAKSARLRTKYASPALLGLASPADASCLRQSCVGSQRRNVTDVQQVHQAWVRMTPFRHELCLIL